MSNPNAAIDKAIREDRFPQRTDATVYCDVCKHDHCTDDLPPVCEICGDCLTEDWSKDYDVCAECDDERNECQCPGGEELGPCSCPACSGVGR